MRYAPLFAALAAVLWAPFAAAQPREDFTPALFVVRDADSTLYLYGTVHMLPPGSEWASERVRAALAEADEVWTETNFYDEERIRVYAEEFWAGLDTPAATPLTQRLNAAQQRRMLMISKALGISRRQLDAMEPWEAALMLVGIEPEHATSEAGVDQQVVNTALRAGVRTNWLEEGSVAEMAALPQEVQLEFLLYIIEGEQTDDDVSEGDRLWRQGKVEELFAREIEPMRAAYPNLYGWIVVERNTAWMDKLVREMNGAGVDFVAVGAAHLAGPHSLPAMFAQRGYTVERLSPAN
ncbi:MAG: TraB/GumN family protein [Hyphomonadaceae bacterium]